VHAIGFLESFLSHTRGQQNYALRSPFLQQVNQIQQIQQVKQQSGRKGQIGASQSKLSENLTPSSCASKLLG